MCLDNLSGCELLLLANFLAISLSENLSLKEIETLIVLLSAVISNLSLIALKKGEENS